MNSNVPKNKNLSDNISKLKKKIKKREKVNLEDNSNLEKSDSKSSKDNEGTEKKGNESVNTLFDSEKVNGCKTNYSCKVCPYKSQTKKDILRHVKDVHSDSDRVQCSVCMKSFKNKNSLRSHCGIAHKSEKKAATKDPVSEKVGDDENVDMTVEVTPMTAIKTEVVDEDEKVDELLFNNVADSPEEDEPPKLPQIDGYFMSVGERVKFKEGLSVFDNLDFHF